MKLNLICISVLIGLGSCTKTPLPSSKTVYDKSYLLLNEGAFTGGTATIQAISKDSVIEQSFLTENGLPLGNIGQHMLIEDTVLAVSLNNAATVRGISRATMQEMWTSSVASPRFMASTGSQLVVANWGSDYIKLLDLYSGTVDDSINVYGVSESVLIDYPMAYVTLNGGFGNDQRVAIVDLTTKSVDTVTVGDKPQSLVKTGGLVYVLCAGYEDWAGTGSTPASIWTIEASGNAQELIAAPTSSDHASYLRTDGNELFFLNATYNGAIVKTSFSPSSWPAITLSPSVGYALDLQKDTLYLHNAKDFASNGTTYSYSTTGHVIDSVDAGIIPRQLLK